MVMHGSTKYVPKHVKEQREIQAIYAPAPIAAKPPAPKIRADVEPMTSNLTLYGETPNPMCPAPIDPKTFRPKDWCSVTKSQFQPLPYVAISKETQLERARFQMSSDLPLNEESAQVFNPAVGFAGKETQTKTDFKPLEREWYVNRPATFAIGGGGATGGAENETVRKLTAKGANPFSGQTTHSDVHLKETDKMEPHLYETLTKRQYQPYPIDKALNAVDKARRWENKKDMVASHFVVGTDRTRYDTASKVHLPSEKPMVKNQIISTAPTDAAHNPHIAVTAKDARPGGLTAKEVAYRKATSSVPVLTKNNPEYHQYGGAWPSTSTQYATPAWCPERQPGWQLFGNGLGGVRLGHEDHYAPNPDGTYSPKRSNTALGGSTNMDTSSATAGRPASNATPPPTFGRRSATPSLQSNSATNISSVSLGGAAGTMGGAVVRNTDPRWISASKSSFKGFQYQ